MQEDEPVIDADELSAQVRAQQEFYPTPGIMKMLADYKQMASLREDDPLYRQLQQQLDEKYAAVTGFESMLIVNLCVEFFKRHLAFALTQDFKKNMPNFDWLCSEINKHLPPEQRKLDQRDHVHMAGLYKFILERRILNKNVFLLRTRDGGQFSMFDMLETDVTRRPITTEECGCCKKRDVPLQKCKRCLRAAYCNKSCQGNDWTFHKQYCEHLAGKG
jgi:hypothetical protein